MAWQAKEELIKSFNQKEQEANDQLVKREKMLDEQRRKVRALKRYARDLKYHGEEWAPPGHPLPDVFILPPPVALDDDSNDDYLRRQMSEVDRLKDRNRNLEDDLRKLTDAKPNASIGIEARQVMHDLSVQNSLRGSVY